MARMTLGDIHALIATTLIRCSTSPANAAAVARALTSAEAIGQGGHGLRRLPAYAGQALSGKVDGMAVPLMFETRPGTLAIDAGNGFAYPAMEMAIDWLKQAAPVQGIAAAGIHRSHHCGVAGLPVEELAGAGLVAMMFANAPAAMAPWGGKRPLYGTDPIAFAAPRRGAAPVVVDISLSKVARGRIMAADQRREPIPEGWALDRDGNPTRDAKTALAGTMTPMGEAKGTALALMVELLAAGLTGAHFGFEASSFFTADGPPPGVGQMILALDANAFSASAVERIEAMAQAVESEEGARLPGGRRIALRQAAERDGLELDDRLLAEIETLGRDQA